MFFSCYDLTALDVSGFDTSNVTDMGWMFFDCHGLTALDVSGFDTSNVTDMWDMFSCCSGLTTLDVSGFDTSNVTNMDGMFYGCSKLKSIYISDKFTTDAVTSSGYMFTDCFSLVGGMGTKYNSSYVNKTYARIDGGTDAPGYFTLKGQSVPPTITSAAASGGKLSVTFSASSAGLTAAAFFDTNGRFLAMSSAPASGASVQIPLPDGLPAVYDVRVTLLQTDTLRPLCTPYPKRIG